MHSLRGLPPILCLVLGCLALGYFASGAEPANGDLVIDRFPADVGNSWDYTRTFYLVMHDTSAGDSVEYLVVDSLHAEFLSVDLLDGWKCYKYSSQLFEAGNVYSDIVWYAHPDSAFLEIAYTPPTHAGPPWKDAVGFGFDFGGRYFTNLEEFRLYLHQMRTSRFADSHAETTYWKPPKKLFVFPLTAGMEWISMTDPWKEERKVVGEEAVEVPAGLFHTLRIEMRPDMESFWLYQWLSELGVIKDSAYFDTTEAINEFGDTVGYVLGYDRYELLRGEPTEVQHEGSQDGSADLLSIPPGYPNPFCTSSLIRFSLSGEGCTKTTLKIYNILGREVRTLVDEQKCAGDYEILWDGKDDRGMEVASGVYFCRLTVGEITKSKKIILAK
ncbi:MAG: T9SS type A sorting domain-containing protein [Candidatus Zixiibacteriota bacterium]|nr:MAG: T9SS type A sorting domain-containing protein [candidate division Zixibacteria bacterium]